MRAPGAWALVLLLAACGAGEPSGEGGPPSGPDASATDAGVSLPDTPAGRLVARSLAFHDPTGAWPTASLELRLTSTDLGGDTLLVADLSIEEAGTRFDLDMERRGDRVTMAVEGDSAVTTVNGAPASEAPAEVRERLGLDREEGLYLRNYFLFLVGLPMKIADPGAELLPEVETSRFFGREVRAVRVRYDSERWPWWAFYFDADDARLVGAQFWNRDRRADGEHLLMEGVTEVGPLRLPARREWFTNIEKEPLGVDRLTARGRAGG